MMKPTRLHRIGHVLAHVVDLLDRQEPEQARRACEDAQRLVRDDVAAWERRAVLARRGCAVCGDFPGEIYMLEDATWAAAGLGPRDVAHWTCVEQRLGRRLRLADLRRDPPCNEAYRELLARLESGEVA